jgi:hypothetical protein
VSFFAFLGIYRHGDRSRNASQIAEGNCASESKNPPYRDVIRTTELFVGVDAGVDVVLLDSHLFPRPNNDLFSGTEDASFAETHRKRVLLRQF